MLKVSQCAGYYDIYLSTIIAIHLKTNLRPMAKFYFFSPEKLKYIEIKYFKFKTLATAMLISFLIAAIFLTVFFIHTSNRGIDYLSYKNRILQQKINNLKMDFLELEKGLSEISAQTGYLRVSVDLPSTRFDIENLGTGGKQDKAIGVNPIIAQAERLAAFMNFEKTNIFQIENKLKKRDSLFAHIPAVKPMDVGYGDSFGMRVHPILKVRRMHEGIDFKSDIGGRICAPGDGVVEFVGLKGGYGLTLEINHGFGYKTLYGHLYRAKVKIGQEVKRGELVALSGNSGLLSTGPHLHYEVKKNGVAMNPLNYFFDNIDMADLNEPGLK